MLEIRVVSKVAEMSDEERMVHQREIANTLIRIGRKMEEDKKKKEKADVT